jgi:hypothetical protein
MDEDVAIAKIAVARILRCGRFEQILAVMGASLDQVYVFLSGQEKG